MRQILPATVVLWVLCLVKPALADALPESGQDAAFYTKIEQAQQHYKDAHYEECLTLLQEAYGLYPWPRLHYNLAKCHQGAKENAGELKHLELFLAADPEVEKNPELLKQVQERIARLRTVLGVNKPPAPPLYKRWWFWSVLGVAAAGTAAGIAGGVVASQNGSTSASLVPVNDMRVGLSVRSVSLQFGW